MDITVRNLFIMSFLIANTDDDGVFRMSLKEASKRTGFDYRTIQKFINSQTTLQQQCSYNVVTMQLVEGGVSICISSELQGIKKLQCSCNVVAMQLQCSSKTSKNVQSNKININHNSTISSDSNIINHSNNNISLKEENTKEERFSFLKGLTDAGVSEQVAKDWMRIRKSKKASDTQTALSRIINQFEIVKRRLGDNPDDCLGMAIDKGWYGFQAEWYINEKSRNNDKQFRTDNSINGDVSREKKYIEGSLSDFD